MADVLPPPCPHAVRALDLMLAAARRQELAHAARTEAARFRHELAAVALRWQAEAAAGLIKGGGDG